MSETCIFVPGTRVTEENMIGYERFLQDICDCAFVPGISRGVSISGMHQVGKTSLVEMVLTKIQEQMGPYIGVYVNIHGDIIVNDPKRYFVQLLKYISSKIKRELRRRRFEDPVLKQEFLDVEELQDENTVRMCFNELLNDLGSYQHLHLVLFLDEFDSAKDHFSNPDYEFLRSIATSPKFNTSLFFISRRKLKHIVGDNGNNSVLPNSVGDIPIKGFDAGDVQNFYAKLENLYGIVLKEEEKELI